MPRPTKKEQTIYRSHSARRKKKMQKDGLWLRQCPFCGSDNVRIIRIRLNSTRSIWAVKCCNCGVSLLRETEEAARSVWNSRYSEAANDLPRLKNLHEALTYCGSKNTFPSIEEPCRKDSCPLFPSRMDENAVCVTCIETVFRNAADVVKNILDEQSETE